MTTPESGLLPEAEPVRLIDENGTGIAHERYTMPTPERLLAGYRDLVIGRRINDQAGALARQGRVAVYPSSHGQEACQVAAGRSLDTQDWLFPTYRDSVAVMTRGIPAVETLLLFRGDWHNGYDSAATRTAPLATPLATQLLHATGAAHAAKLQGRDEISIALCGDGSTSEGDFHEALNFAAVFRTGTVFLIQNNEYAISVPLAKQSQAPSLAHKGIGYGVPGVRVDGNDLAALFAVMDEATARARRGEGPTLIEAHTYRMQSHTNADDATRYREDEEVQSWIARDPLSRLRSYLRAEGLLDDAAEEAFAADAELAAAAVREAIEGREEPDPTEIFRHVYTEMPADLAAQEEQLRDELARNGATS